MVDNSLPYAQALLSLAQDANLEDAYLNDFEKVEMVFDQNPELHAWLAHPAITAQDKEKLLLDIFSEDVQPTFADFLKIACRHQMSGDLLKIDRNYRALLDEARNVQNVFVQSAAPLDDDQKARLQRALEKKLGGTVRLECSVDPALIAGMKIRTGDAVLDASYQGQLEKMKEQLMKS